MGLTPCGVIHDTVARWWNFLDIRRDESGPAAGDPARLLEDCARLARCGGAADPDQGKVTGRQRRRGGRGQDARGQALVLAILLGTKLSCIHVVAPFIKSISKSNRS